MPQTTAVIEPGSDSQEMTGCVTSNAQPMVSVILPSYNHEAYVSQAIQSVVAQTYQNVELIVLDDGSTDQSVNLIQDLAKVYGFAVVARENRGLAKTLNEGLNLARGKYVSFVGSDDYYHPRRIERAVEQLEQTSGSVACVYCDGDIVDHMGRRIGLFGERHPRPWLGSTYDNLVVGNWIPGLGATFKTRVIREFMFDDRFMIEDHTLFLRMFKDGRLSLKYYEDIGFAYRWHRGNVSNPGPMMDRENRLIEQWFEDVGRYAEFKRCLKTRSSSLVNTLSARNCYLLMLHLARWLRRKAV
ncbi:MAG TPA: glycosyltransferase [Nitrospira sp.]|nr:glycosyltransferase [Nitrospira sp.]